MTREQEMRAVLEFYADPQTYFAVMLVSDPPAGDIMEDFGSTELGMKPGKKARDLLDRYDGEGVWDAID